MAFEGTPVYWTTRDGTATGGGSVQSAAANTIVQQTSDFSIAANPASLTIQQGGTSTISTAVTSGSADTVNLTVSGLPSGASASLNPTSVTAGGSSTLSVNAGTAPLGTYTLTVTGTQGSITHSAAVSLTFTAPTTTILIVGGASGTYGGTASLSATLLSSAPGNPPVGGQTVSFSLKGTPVGSGITDGNGFVQVSASIAGINGGNCLGCVTASFAGSANYAAISV